jgi:hypothetical protein
VERKQSNAGAVRTAGAANFAGVGAAHLPQNPEIG